MNELHDYGGLLLGTRLKRASDTLFAGVDRVYKSHGVDLSPRCFPILFLLRDNGPMGVQELATQLGQSHSAVSQMSRTLAVHGVMAEKNDPADERRRLLSLSPKGVALMGRLGNVWRAITGAVDDLSAAARVDLPAALTAMESSLQTRDFAERIADRLRLQEAGAVEIIPFEARYRDDFKRLNIEWLEKYFYVEAIDHEVLSHPEDQILKPGGFVFLARYQGEIVGTCALIKASRGRFELSKMAVTERYQGLRIGHRLLTAAIAQFQRTGAKQLFLESSSKLKRALELYQANGFQHAPRPKGYSHYQRSDVYMVYQSGVGAHAPSARRQ
jgi:DNA-binding MarR family transcriptional regulator/N-acetylglutamate synthase-like GNAT family acetyltransferase